MIAASLGPRAFLRATLKHGEYVAERYVPGSLSLTCAGELRFETVEGGSARTYHYDVVIQPVTARRYLDSIGSLFVSGDDGYDSDPAYTAQTIAEIHEDEERTLVGLGGCDHSVSLPSCRLVGLIHVYQSHRETLA